MLHSDCERLDTTLELRGGESTQLRKKRRKEEKKKKRKKEKKKRKKERREGKHSNISSPTVTFATIREELNISVERRKLKRRRLSRY